MATFYSCWQTTIKIRSWFLTAAFSSKLFTLTSSIHNRGGSISRPRELLSALSRQLPCILPTKLCVAFINNSMGSVDLTPPRISALWIDEQATTPQLHNSTSRFCELELESDLLIWLDECDFVFWSCFQITCIAEEIKTMDTITPTLCLSRRLDIPTTENQSGLPTSFSGRVTNFYESKLHRTWTHRNAFIRYAI